MEIKMFSWGYFIGIGATIIYVLLLYFLLRHRTDKTKKIVLFFFLALGLAFHFLKVLWPPYSLDHDRMLRDIWFQNVCAANILIFPFIFLSKNKYAKDYMFYIGIISGLMAILYPLEPMQVADQSAQWMDTIRFYFHHATLFAVPLMMVVLGLHQVSYKRVWAVPFCLLAVGGFIMLNQILQSELGFITMRGDDITKIPYKNPSLIWGPNNEAYSKVFTVLCPKIFTKIPVGAHAGETKYWPLIWLAVPVIVYLIPLCFIISLVFNFKEFKEDIAKLKRK